MSVIERSTREAGGSKTAWLAGETTAKGKARIATPKLTCRHAAGIRSRVRATPDTRASKRLCPARARLQEEAKPP